MWDPKNRPTSTQALNHEYFADAVDPLRPKSSTARLLGRKMSDKSFKSPTKDVIDSPALSAKSSWFRRSLIGRSESPAPVIEQEQQARTPVVTYSTVPEAQAPKNRSVTNKRATWANGAPMPILPSIRPVSPLSNAVTAQANSSLAHASDHPSVSNQDETGKSSTKKIGRQLSMNSNGNHYADVHRQEAEKALNGIGGGANSTTTQKESFFSHLRKRARRLSGRNPAAAANYDIEANAGCAPWSNRSSVALDSANAVDSKSTGFTELDKALQNVKYDIDSPALPAHLASPSNNTPSKRQSMPQGSIRSMTESPTPMAAVNGPISSRTRRALQMASHPVHRYETPEEEDELLDEVLHSTNKAARRLAQRYNEDSTPSMYKDDGRLSTLANDSSHALANPYPTPSPSAKRDGVSFGQRDMTPLRRTDAGDEKTGDDNMSRQWPTPPYGENEWASSVAASILATGSTYR
jgi:meiosis induction protein kinase IME2/SME1